jgi:hypothetical protein
MGEIISIGYVFKIQFNTLQYNLKWSQYTPIDFMNKQAIFEFRKQILLFLRCLLAILKNTVHWI